MLEVNGFNVKVIDGQVTWLNSIRLEKEIDDYSPDMIGISVVTPRAKQALEIASIVKRKKPEICVVLGGPHITALDGQVITKDDIDVVVLGEGEYTMLDLVKAMSGNKDLSAIAGILYKEKDGSVVRTKRREMVKDIDRLPHPAFHLMPIDKYTPPAAWPNRKKGAYANLMTSRGCPHQCTYCDVNITFGRKYRMHSPEYVLDDIECLYHKHKVKNFSFRDSIFTLHKDRVKKICRLINERGLDISWECNLRVNYVDYDLLKMMKDAGCGLVRYGVESGSQEVLNNACRNTTLDQIRQAFKVTKKAGLEVHGYFMLGLPGETKKTIKDTIKFAKEISPDSVGFTIAIPFPGTEFYNWAKEHDYLRIDDWNSFVYNSAIVETPSLSIKDLMKIQEWALKSYYLRPSQIFKQFIQMRSWNDLTTNMKYAKLLLFRSRDIHSG